MARILMVDDDTGTLRLLKLMLQRYNHSLELAFNGIQALERMAHTPFDLLITDIMMPEMDGLTLIEKVRAKQENVTMPIIVITANGYDNISEAATAKGASYILTQPFSSKELSQAVSNCLDQLQ